MSKQQQIDPKKEGLFYLVNKQPKICCIYMIISPSGRKYIGQTIHFIFRMYKYSRMICDKQPKLFNSFKKYGWDNHVFEILEICDKDKLNELEDYYINLHNTFNTEIGMNLRSGGNHSRLSKESREKLRQANLGKKYSKETNYKKGSGLRGKNISEEVKKKNE